MLSLLTHEEDLWDHWWLTQRVRVRATTGATLSDLLFLVLIVSFVAGNHFARTQALKQLQLVLADREQANIKLQQATKAKTEFLANMSHGK